MESVQGNPSAIVVPLPDIEQPLTTTSICIRIMVQQQSCNPDLITGYAFGPWGRHLSSYRTANNWKIVEEVSTWQDCRVECRDHTVHDGMTPVTHFEWFVF